MSSRIKSLVNKLMLQPYLSLGLTAIGFLLLIIVMGVGIALHVTDISHTLYTSFHQSHAASNSSIHAIRSATTKLDDTINNYVAFKPYYIDWNGLYQRVMNKRIVEDVVSDRTIYKTSAKQLVFLTERTDAAPYIAQLNQLHRELNKLNIPLLYVIPPTKITNSEQQLPPGVHDYLNENTDQLVAGLQRNQIQYLDLRQTFQQASWTPQQTFFTTDHHWTIEAAFHGYSKLVDKLNTDYSFTIDRRYQNIDNYQITVFPRFFLGSQGRRVGKLYAGVDDFSLITPNFPTQQTVTQIDTKKPITFKGPYEQSVLVPDYIDPTKPDSTNRYAVYHGDHAELIFNNEQIASGKVLLIKDSYALPVYSFLSLCVNELRALDLRLYKRGTAIDYIKQHKPEIVIVMYSGLKPGMFDFDRISSAKM